MMRTLSLPCLSPSIHNRTNTSTTYHSPPCSKCTCFIFTPYKRHHCKIIPCSSSLRQSKKQLRKINTVPPSGIKRRLFSPKSDGDGDKKDLDLEGGSALKGTLLAGVLLVGVVGGFASVGYIYRDNINSFLNYFSVFIEGNVASSVLHSFTLKYTIILLSVLCFYPFLFTLTTTRLWSSWICIIRSSLCWIGGIRCIQYPFLIHSITQLTTSQTCTLNFDFGLFNVPQILAIPAIPLTMSAGLLFGSLVGTIIVSISGTVSLFL